MNLIKELAGGIGNLFEPNVAVAFADATQSTRPVWPAEEAAIRNAVPKRRAEYRAARYAARNALSELGHELVAIPSAADRTPIWPKGIVGSISHCDGICVAALARAEHHRSMGVDIEMATAVNSADLDTICTATEKDWLARQPKADQRRMAALIFSAKESAYKAQYPISKQLFDFSVFTIIPDLTKGNFAAKFTRDIAGFQKGKTLNGRFAFVCGMVVSGLSIGHHS